MTDSEEGFGPLADARTQPGAEGAVVGHQEAKEAALRLIAGAFRRDGERLEPGRTPRFSIPCRPEQDDDCVILEYITQQAAISPSEQEKG